MYVCMYVCVCACGSVILMLNWLPHVVICVHCGCVTASYTTCHLVCVQMNDVSLSLSLSLSVSLPPSPSTVCAENHVRSWTVTRFRGRISTQPGSTPIASFKVLSLEGAHSLFYPINSIGEAQLYSFLKAMIFHFAISCSPYLVHVYLWLREGTATCGLQCDQY